MITLRVSTHTGRNLFFSSWRTCPVLPVHVIYVEVRRAGGVSAAAVAWDARHVDGAPLSSCMVFVITYAPSWPSA